MRVFISWSGEPSREIAAALADWLEDVVQHVDAWMSDKDIGSGVRWNDAIVKALDETNFGIVCVTRANQHAPWLIFEAGAVAKSVGTAKVVPLLIDMPPSDLEGPLTAFQSRTLDEDGMRRLVQDVNDIAEKKIPTERLQIIFNRSWPELRAAVDEALNGTPPDQEPQRKADDMLAELVETTRRIERSLDGGSSAAAPQGFLVLEAKGSRGKTALGRDLLWQHSRGVEPDALWLLRPSEAEEANQPNTASESED